MTRKLLTSGLATLVLGFLASLLGLPLGQMFSGWFWGNLLVAVVGAVILLTAIKMVRGRST